MRISQASALLASLAAFSAIAQPALYDDIRRGRLSSVEQYLASGGSPNAAIPGASSPNVTLLRVAILGYREDIALKLLSAGADIEASGVDLKNAAETGLTRVVEFLARRYPSASAQELGLGAAVTFGYYDVVQILVKRKGEWTTGADHLVINALGKYDDIARLLLDNGAQPQPGDLREAILSSSPGMVRHLLSLGADPLVRFRDSPGRPTRSQFDGFDAADFALWTYKQSEERETSMVKLGELVRAGVIHEGDSARQFAKDGSLAIEQTGDPAARLRLAAKWGFADVVKQMLADKVVTDPNILRTAALDALRSRADDVARLLFESGASVNGGPLHVAVRVSSPGMVRLLIALGADPNERLNGYTPAQYWWRQDPSKPAEGPKEGWSRGVLQELIAAGADVCWLKDYARDLQFSTAVLWFSASQCWPPGAPDTLAGQVPTE